MPGMAKSRIANFSNLGDNFLFRFSVRLVGLVNFVSREYEENRSSPTNLDFRYSLVILNFQVEIFEIQYFQKFENS